MQKSLAVGLVISMGAAIGGLMIGNLLFPPEPGRGWAEALPFTLIGAFLILWPAHGLILRRIGRLTLRYAMLVLVGFVAGGSLLGLTLAIAGVSHPKAFDFALIGASYGGLTAIFWAALHWATHRTAADQ